MKLIVILILNCKLMKTHLFNIHHKIKLKLDAICQEEGDMNTEEFMEVYNSLKPDSKEHDEVWNPQRVDDGSGPLLDVGVDI